jgi:hypothetical protein
MGKAIVGVLIGIGLGVGGTLAAQRYRRLPDTPQRHQARLLSTAPLLLERSLPGVKVLDVGLTSPPVHSVNYVYDELYDVHISYQQSDEVREIVLPFGFSQGTEITPSTADFVIANDGATVIRRLKPSGRP